MIEPCGAAAGDARRLVWLEKSVAGLAKAKHADVDAYTSQVHVDSPDAFVGGPGLAGARQITSTSA